MKKIITLSLFSSLSLFATNGDNLIGYGSKSRALGGTGIANFLGSSNIFSNPALISEAKNDELDVGVTYFTPTIKTNETKSKADKNFIPHFAYSKSLDNNLYFGLGLFGSAGMGVDFRNSQNPSLWDARTNLLLLKIAPTLAYKNGDFSFGISPLIQYGELNISYIDPTNTPNGLGKSDDLGFGYKLGTAYNITPNLKIGATYQSSIKLEYKNTLSTASIPFVNFGLISSTFSDKLEQPEEYGVGLSYDINNFTFSTDYKKIKWQSAIGYKDFGWNNQDVYSLGIKYEENGTWYGIGYNYSKNPITNYAGITSTQQVLNTFNYIFFPATQEKHFTFGAGTTLSKNLSFDLGFIYAPKNSITTTGLNGSSIKVSHSENSATLGFKYKF